MKKDIKRLAAFNYKTNYTILPEFVKSKIHILFEISEDIPGAIVSRPPLKKANGNIVNMVFDKDEFPAETSSFRYRYSENKSRS